MAEDLLGVVNEDRRRRGLDPIAPSAATANLQRVPAMTVIRLMADDQLDERALWPHELLPDRRMPAKATDSLVLAWSGTSVFISPEAARSRAARLLGRLPFGAVLDIPADAPIVGVSSQTGHWDLYADPALLLTYATGEVVGFRQ